MDKKKPNPPQYSLDQILEFAGPEKDDQINLISMLLDSVEKNANSFRDYLNSANRKEACELAHKMLTTVRQLRASRITSLLEQLERIDNPTLTDSRFFELGQLACNEITILLGHIKGHHLQG